MAEAYLAGRLLVNYALVWVVLLVTSRFDWRPAFWRSSSWWAC